MAGRLVLKVANLRLALMAGAALFALQPAQAQETNVSGRVTKLEKEMKAVQRKVFGAGESGTYFDPEITPETRPTTSSPTGGTALTDLTSRVDALEQQLATLTGQVEQNSNRLRQLESWKATTDGKVKALEAGAASAPIDDVADATPTTPRPTAPAPRPTTPAPKPAPASDARKAAVAAIERPSSGDAGEDSYLYGYRLWDAKFFPEAQVALADTIKKFPKHKRASHSRNLLGRAWLDDGKPATSTKIFLENYQTDPRGERAPDSLLYLGVALTQLKKVTEACQAFGELAEVYPEAATGRLSSQLGRARTAAKCK